MLRVLMGHSTINITQIYIHLAAQMHLVSDNYNSNLDKLLVTKNGSILNVGVRKEPTKLI
mgnify:CR=1 FL=1